MKENSEGFLEPSLNNALCVSCGMCESICPILNEQCNESSEQHCYLVTTQHEQYYRRSATMGLCTMLAEHFLNEKGVVFGVWLDESEWKARHICISNTVDLEKIRNSKYLQSDSALCLEEVKAKLETGEKVLFVGTPCQVAGLKAFLGRQYANLITVDLICHGVYSYKLFREEIHYWESKLKGKVRNFRFRSKEVFPWVEGGIIYFDLLKKKGETIHFERHGKYSPTYRCYAYSGDGFNYNLRKSCYSCHYRNPARYGDLTVGDAWLVDDKYLDWNQINCSRGVSLAIVNTVKGSELLNRVSAIIQQKEIPQEAAFVQPALLPASRTIPIARQELYQQLGKEDYGDLVNRLLNIDLEKLYERDQRQVKNKAIKKKIKELVYGKRNRPSKEMSRL